MELRYRSRFGLFHFSVDETLEPLSCARSRVGSRVHLCITLAGDASMLTVQKSPLG